MLVCIADGRITAGVASRGVVPPDQIGLASGAGRARMADHMLVCATNRGNAFGIVTCGDVHNIDCASWATLDIAVLARMANFGIAAGIGNRSIISMPISLASGARNAPVTPNLLSRAAECSVAVGVTT
jgi:hypothetical protein